MKGELTLEIKVSDANGEQVNTLKVSIPYDNYSDMVDFFLDSTRKGLAEGQYVSGWVLTAI